MMAIEGGERSEMDIVHHKPSPGNHTYSSPFFLPRSFSCPFFLPDPVAPHAPVTQILIGVMLLHLPPKVLDIWYE
ncbi:hypothetical protein E3N88_21290 [Mikania micrantha]|uniref:Uncharacterized protein n=1 Tax=Mikania micrantha TaxID=192012 RepID=A0A5N6NM75_9ASTR|nr:hypothetical protein E3N88_21290 [Mikania micrantha]